ncbi:LysR family transcriptional regulator substrate-binding protein [Peribacillus butanolivorans]|uniref:LysR family transcriptional regulator substrate-binding protein n=1 Tax=Peribacillus butanolivorans TaxID=421767 RepID=UPI003D291881
MAGLIESSISVSIALPHILPILIVEFLKLNPNVHISQYSASSTGMKKQLENVEVDLCISMSPIYGDDIEWMPLLEPRDFFIGTTKPPLSKAKIHCSS